MKCFNTTGWRPNAAMAWECVEQVHMMVTVYRSVLHVVMVYHIDTTHMYLVMKHVGAINDAISRGIPRLQSQKIQMFFGLTRQRN